MALDTLRRALHFVALCLAQALVFNHVHLFGYATVLLYVYFVVIFPRSYPRWAILLWSFAMGLVIDLFANTPGVAAASLTLIGLLQPYVMELFIPREAPANLRASAADMGRTKFYVMTAMLTLLFCMVFYSLEMFTFANWLSWAFSVVGSWLLTLVLMTALESVRKS